VYLSVLNNTRKKDIVLRLSCVVTVDRHRRHMTQMTATLPTVISLFPFPRDHHGVFLCFKTRQTKPKLSTHFLGDYRDDVNVLNKHGKNICENSVYSDSEIHLMGLVHFRHKSLCSKFNFIDISKNLLYILHDFLLQRLFGLWE
jgi:hypothetical protein